MWTVVVRARASVESRRLGWRLRCLDRPNRVSHSFPCIGYSCLFLPSTVSPRRDRRRVTRNQIPSTMTTAATTTASTTATTSTSTMPAAIVLDTRPRPMLACLFQPSTWGTTQHLRGVQNIFSGPEEGPAHHRPPALSPSRHMPAFPFPLSD